jgi:glutathione S-transferase
MACKKYENFHIELIDEGARCRVIHAALTLSHLPMILEYLDEMIPSPPLMPVYPAARAIHRELLQEAMANTVTQTDIAALTRSSKFLNSAVMTTLDLYVYAQATKYNTLKDTAWYDRINNLPSTKIAASTNGDHYATT